jgi:hypothetical protein
MRQKRIHPNPKNKESLSLKARGAIFGESSRNKRIEWS